MSSYLDFLNELKEKKLPDIKQINGVKVSFDNSNNEAGVQFNLDHSSHALFISQLKNDDIINNDNLILELNNADVPATVVVVEKKKRAKQVKTEEQQAEQEEQAKQEEQKKRAEPQEIPPIIMNNQRYYMNNRKHFVENIGKMLHHYSAEIESKEGAISCKNQGSGKFETLVHQKVVLDYLNLNTPYRGLLLYHGLGSGKTCTAIAIAEGMKSHNRVIVMTPASLQMNFVSELKKCGDPLYKKLQQWEFIKNTAENEKEVEELATKLSVPMDYVKKKKGIWKGIGDKPSNFSTYKEKEQKLIEAQLNLMIQTKYTNLNYNGGIKQKHLDELTQDDKKKDEKVKDKKKDEKVKDKKKDEKVKEKNPFDNSVVIIDEAHNFVSRIVNKLPKNVGGKGKDSLEKFNLTMSGKLYNFLMEASNVRIVLLTGTPIINYPNEIGILFNIIRGAIKSWEFDLEINTTNKINRDKILDMFDADRFADHDFVSYSNNKLVVTRNPFGFVNTKKEPVRVRNVRVGGTRRANKAHNNNTTKKVVRNGYDNMLLPQMEYPDNETQSGGVGAFTDYSGVVFNPNSKMTDVDFVKRVKGVLNTNGITSVKDTIVVHKCLPDISETFMKEFIDTQKGDLKNENVFKRRILGLTSYFRSAQENLLPRYEMSESEKIYHLVLCEMSDFQIGVYDKVRKAEAESEKNKRKNEAKNAGKNSDDILTIPSTYRIFSRACCNFAFPGGKLERPRPDKIVVKEVDKKKGDAKVDEEVDEEGVVGNMRANGEFDDMEDNDDEDQNENHVDGIARRKAKRNKPTDKPVADESTDEPTNEVAEKSPYENKIIEVMKELRNIEYLGPSGLSTYSPKFSKILENIMDPKNIGLHLLYSNFRTIEGVGILKMVLEMNGYAEFKLKKDKTNWVISEEPGDVNKPKFVLYTGTESTEEKEIVRNIYNGSWELVPPTIAKSLMAKSPKTKNMYGDIIKVLMITSSGAEGINLKNTRYVHIVEPYWHMVRVQQVIGRARRICSHEELPIELQTIKVFIYVTTFSDKQRKSEDYKELHLIDKSKLNSEKIVTTDESLFEMAERKDTINQKLLNAVKSTAMDCKLYNKSGSGYVCYNTGRVVNNDFVSIPDITTDKNNITELKQNFNNKELELLSLKIGEIEYFLDENTKDIYDGKEVKETEARGDMHNLKPIGNLKTDINGNKKIVLKKTNR
jgi:hypothetical protein